MPTFGPPASLNANAASDSEDDFGPQLATDGAGTWLAVWHAGPRPRPPLAVFPDFDILVARSSDDGVTWTAPVALNANAASDSGDDTNPQIATDGAGTWVAVWQSDDPLGTTGSDFDILVARSNDDGVTWTAPVALNANAASDSGNDTDPHVTSDGAGTWVAVWHSNDPLGTTGSDFDILVARSSDDGATWTAPAALDPNAASDLRNDTLPRVTTDGAGTWVAVWNADELVNFATDLDVLFSRSTDGGATWTLPAPLNTADSGGPHRHDDFDARVATDGGGNWVAVWESNDPLGSISNDFDILVARSSDGAVTWSAAETLTSSTAGGTDLDPQVTTDGAGTWLVLWQSTRSPGATGGDWDTLVARSTDAGATWTAPAFLNASAGSDSGADLDPQIVTDASGNWMAVAVWHAFGLPSTDTDVRFWRGSAPFTPPAALDPNAANDSGEDFAPQLAADGAGTWVAVWDSSDSLGGSIGDDQDVLVTRSSDGGRSWAMASALDSGAANDSGTDRSPQLTTDGAGTWVAVWESDNATGGLGLDFDILTARSGDGGASWTAPAALNTNAAGDSGADLAPQVASDGAGAWVAVWESRDPLDGLGTDSDILVARSGDGGTSWTAPAALNTNAAGDSGADLAPQVASDGAGAWVAVWESRDPLDGLGTDSDILVARSGDGGASWTAPAALNTNAAGDSGEDLAPQVATDGAGTWRAVWESTDSLGGGLGNDSDTLVAESTDGGATWTDPVALNSNAASDTGDDSNPQIDTDGAGAWVAVWISSDALGGPLGTDRDVLFGFGPGPDSDGDGLSDAAEVNLHGTDPVALDTEGDGLIDGDEVNDHGTDPLQTDSDGDQLGDWEEIVVYATDPLAPDSDGDQLDDWEEISVHGTDPLLSDSDGDGLEDGEEISLHGTDPLAPDSDGDGLEDGEEISFHGTDALDPDTDGDGLTDGFEVINGFDPLAVGEQTQDPDLDGLDNLAEQAAGTDPNDSDSDDDALLDGAEVGTYLTDPNNADSDGDGFSDGEEVSAGFDPNDPLSMPSSPVPVPVLGLRGRALLVLLLAGAAGRRRLGGRGRRGSPPQESGRSGLAAAPLAG